MTETTYNSSESIKQFEALKQTHKDLDQKKVAFNARIAQDAELEERYKKEASEKYGLSTADELREETENRKKTNQERIASYGKNLVEYRNLINERQRLYDEIKGQ